MKYDVLAPVCVFAFNRPEHLRRTLTALAANELAPESDVFIYCDGPRNEAETALTDAVRTVARAASGFHSCAVIESEYNKGLAASIIAGVSAIVEEYGRIIVLEDDLLTSPYFLRYMNDGLEMYADNPHVASIHGWCFPHDVVDAPETFFLRGADCLGWGTWKRAWDLFEPNAQRLLDALKQSKLVSAFNCNNSYDYMEMLRNCRDGKVSSWAVRWRASTFLNDMYTLHPGRSLVQHAGGDGMGTNAGVTDLFDVPLTNSPVYVSSQLVKASEKMSQANDRFHQQFNISPFWQKRVKRFIQSYLLGNASKSFAKRWLPPALLDMVRQRLGTDLSDTLRWEGGYPNWQSAVAASTGYDEQAIFEKVGDAARAVRDGRALWERDSVLFYHEEYNWPLVAMLLRVAVSNGGRLSVLDFGGALGSTYQQNKRFFEGLDLSWNVVEQAHVVESGRAEFTIGPVSFWHSIQECAAACFPDVVLFSGVLQYIEEPYGLLKQATALCPRVIIVERTPYAEQGERITVQHVPKEIYAGSYPCRWLDRQRVKLLLEDGYRLLPDYIGPADPPGFCGFIAIRKENHAEPLQKGA